MTTGNDPFMLSAITSAIRVIRAIRVHPRHLRLNLSAKAFRTVFVNR